MTYFLRDYDILTKQELHSSLWVNTAKSMVFDTRNLKYCGPSGSGTASYEQRAWNLASIPGQVEELEA